MAGSSSAGRCLRCGHAALEHVVVRLEGVRIRGRVRRSVTIGGCESMVPRKVEEGDDGRLVVETDFERCPCLGFESGRKGLEEGKEDGGAP